MHPRAHGRRAALAAGAAGLVVLASISAVFLVAYVAVEHLAHPPRKALVETPADRGLPYENVGFRTTDGVDLAGWWIPASRAAGVVVYLHGYGETREESLLLAPFLHRQDYAVLAIDFRAHGESGGSFSTAGIHEARDVAAAVRYAESRAPAVPIALFGRSMGAAAALLAAPDLPQVRAVVADSAFARLADVIAQSFPARTGLPAVPFARVALALASFEYKVNPAEGEPVRSVHELSRPLLLIHGEEDDVAPASDARALAAASPSGATLWLVPGARHVGAIEADRAGYEALVRGFLSDHLGGPGDAFRLRFARPA